jgi:hypothetical protein
LAKTSRAKTRKPSSAIVRVSPAPERPWELNEEAITILKNSVAKGASDEELKYCLTVARRYKLDPFKQQIWFVKRWDSSADNGKGGRGAYVWTPQVGINGLLFAAARDHKNDFGSVSLPEYGPMETQEWMNEGKTLKFPAPVWAKVKIWKKGEPEPTEAQAWWDEYAPADLAKAPFWRKMPRRMIAKCATALAIRQAYPDLGGVYIPEECERIEEGYTASGRQIVEGVSTGTHAAAQAVLAEKLAGKRPLSAPEPEKVPTEPPKAQIPTSPIEVKPLRGAIEVDYIEDPTMPYIRGDVAELAGFFPKDLVLRRKNDFWCAFAEDVKRIRIICDAEGFKLEEIRPKAEAKKAPAKQESAGPTIVAGTIERVQPSSDASRAVITFATKEGKKGWTCFDKDIYGILTSNLGKLAEVIIQTRESKGKTYTNLVGLRKVGSTEYDSDGKTPIVQRDRPAGGQTLFP